MEEGPGRIPEQNELLRRAQLAMTVGIVASTVVIIALPLGELLTPEFYYVGAAAGLIFAVSIVRLIAIIRRLRRTGPPFEHLQWWWPRRP